MHQGTSTELQCPMFWSESDSASNSFLSRDGFLARGLMLTHYPHGKATNNIKNITKCCEWYETSSMLCYPNLPKKFAPPHLPFLCWPLSPPLSSTRPKGAKSAYPQNPIHPQQFQQALFITKHQRCFALSYNLEDGSPQSLNHRSSVQCWQLARETG